MVGPNPDPWTELFNGRSLTGWKPLASNHRWEVKDSSLLCRGPASTLLLAGNAQLAIPHSFQLKLEAMTRRGARAELGIFPLPLELAGLRVAIANSSSSPDDPKTWTRTGSLVGRRSIYKTLVPDDTWFRLAIAVVGKRIQVRLNDALLIDFSEPAEFNRELDDYTIALHWMGGNSEVLFRNIYLRELSEQTLDPISLPVQDNTNRAILRCTALDVPVIDLHVHLKGGLTLERALERSRRNGIPYGIAINCGKGFPIEQDEAALAFCSEMHRQPVFTGMQAEGREWTQMFSARTAAAFDYIFTDSMTWSDKSGRRMRLWIPDEVGTIVNADDFMETLVARTEDLLEREPIDIYVNPTFLPAAIGESYNQLWTEQRMQRVIEAAVRNQVAIELNELYQIPSAKFVRLAKAAGCKFALGTNNTSPADLSRSEYGLRMIEHCELRAHDFFVPGTTLEKAILRKAEALRT